MAITNQQSHNIPRYKQNSPNMVYIHYENVIILDKRLTRLVFSSSQGYYNSHLSAIWDDVKRIITFIKQIPVSDRLFETSTKTWVIPTDKFNLISGFFSQFRVYDYIPQSDLTCFINGDQLKRSVFNERKPPSAEEFFYNTTQPVIQGAMPIQVVEQKLEELFSAVDNVITLSALTAEEKLKLYKKAARRFHPDLNNGDGSRMAELNMLWQQYKSMQGVN